MKRSYIKLLGIAFSAVLSVLFITPADAQRGARGSFGGGTIGGGGGGSIGGGGSMGRGVGGGAGIGMGRPSVGNIGPQRNQAVAPRGQAANGANANGVAAGRPSYRSYPGLPTGTNRVTGRPYNGYYNYHGYYNRYYMPYLGYNVGFLPYGYYPFWWGPNQYFYSAGLFYQFNNNQYTVVEPPIGAAIKDLPDNAQSIVINGVQYYELNGVYYEPVTKDDGSVVYQVAGKDGVLDTDNGGAEAYNQNQIQGGASAPTRYPAAPASTIKPPKMGDVVRSIPSDSKRVNVAGQKYLLSADGYYYQETFDNDNNRTYKVVGTPEDEPNR
jgi:hypothetical protein